MDTTIPQDTIERISLLACMKLREALYDGSDQIRRDFHDAVEAAQDAGDEKFPKLKLGFAISFDLEKNELTTDLKWTAARSIKDAVRLDDPDQMKLGLDGKDEG